MSIVGTYVQPVEANLRAPLLMREGVSHGSSKIVGGTGI